MNGCGGMTDIIHRLFFRHAHAGECGGRCDSEGVEASPRKIPLDANARQEIEPDPCRTRRHGIGFSSALVAHFTKSTVQFLVQKDRMIAMSFGVECDSEMRSRERYLGHRVEVGLTEAAAVIARDKKRIEEEPTPAWRLVADRGQNSRQSGSSVFGLESVGRGSESELQPGVEENKPSIDGLVQKHTHLGNLQQRRVASGGEFALSFVGGGAPLKIGRGVCARDLAGMEQFIFVEEHAEVAPGGLRALLILLVALVNEPLHPAIPSFIGAQGRELILFGDVLAQESVGLGEVGQLGALAGDLARGGIEILNPPKRRFFLFKKRCHRYASVCLNTPISTKKQSEMKKNKKFLRAAIVMEKLSYGVLAAVLLVFFNGYDFGMPF